MLYRLYKTNGTCKRVSIKKGFTRDLKEGKKAVINVSLFQRGSSDTSEQQVMRITLPHSDE